MAEDAKYGHVDVPGIRDDEPVFILRAQDESAIACLERYANLHRDVGRDDFHAGVRKVIVNFSDWREENPTLIKIPD